MCTPMLALGLAVSAVQGVMQYQGQMAEYNAAQAHRQANTEAAQRAAVNTYASQQLRIAQEGEAAAQQKQDVALEAQRAMATARAAAGESGVSGLSVDALIRDLSSQQGRYDASVDANYQMTSSYLRSEMDATQDQAVARINSVPVPTKPSFGSSLVNIFSSGINSYATYKQGKG